MEAMGDRHREMEALGYRGTERPRKWGIEAQGDRGTGRQRWQIPAAYWSASLAESMNSRFRRHWSQLSSLVSCI